MRKKSMSLEASKRARDGGILVCGKRQNGLTRVFLKTSVSREKRISGVTRIGYRRLFLPYLKRDEEKYVDSLQQEVAPRWKIRPLQTRSCL